MVGMTEALPAGDNLLVCKGDFVTTPRMYAVVPRAIRHLSLLSLQNHEQ